MIGRSAFDEGPLTSGIVRRSAIKPAKAKARAVKARALRAKND